MRIGSSLIHLGVAVLLSSCGSSDGGAGPADADDTSPGTSDTGTGGDTGGGTDAARDTTSAPDTRAPFDAPPAVGKVGIWENVTAPEMPTKMFSDGFGAGNVVQDPARPTDMYVGGYGSVWKSIDYGLHWTQVKGTPEVPSGPLGHVLAIADDDGKTAQLWIANPFGEKKVYRSKDAGLTYTLTGTLTGGDGQLYSIVVDPYDSKHLVSGFHETDGLAESMDGGETWKFVGMTGWPKGGISWFPFFLDTGEAAGTRGKWLAIAQNGGSLVTTEDSGAHWTIPTGIGGLNHPHGNAGIFQLGKTLFVGGTHSEGTSVGDGVYKSTDLGATWARVSDRGAGVVFGSTKNVYAMWSWACANCKWDGIDVQDMSSPQPGTTWASAAKVANGLNWGPNSVATTSDGTHTIYVGSMWSSGLWRFVEE